VNRQFAVLRLRTFAFLAHDIVAGIEAAVPAIEELEGTAKLFLLLRNTLVRPLNAAQIEELKAAFKMEF
jgi:hypothetical protein